MRLSNSMLRAFFVCPRAYYYRYQMNLVPITEKESAAKLGTLFHRAVELDDTTLLDKIQRQFTKYTNHSYQP